MAAFILMIFLSLSTFAQEHSEDCPVDNDQIKAQLDKQLKCKQELSRDEVKACIKKKDLNFGGIFSVMCSQGDNKGCCYKKISGSTHSKFGIRDCSKDM